MPTNLIDMGIENNQLQKLKSVHKLQRTIIEQCIHNLRSPLGGISGYLELMDTCLNSDGNLQKINRYKEQIGRGIDEIDFIVNHLQDIVKESPAPESPVGAEKSDVCRITEEVCNKMSKMSRQKKKELVFSNSVGPLHLPVDPLLFELILMNLIANAIRYTVKNARISVEISQTPSAARISIISKETTRPVKDIERIFRKEHSGKNGKKTKESINNSSYYFGTDNVKLMYPGAVINVNNKNGFAVNINMELHG